MHPDHYARTFRAWNLALRSRHRQAAELVDAPTLRLVERYLAAGEALFRLGEQTLYRVVLRRRRSPKAWRSPLRPSLVAAAAVPERRRAGGVAGGRAGALRRVQPVLRAVARPVQERTPPGGGKPATTTASRAATARKVRFFLDALDLPEGGRLLDVGCGWGAALARALGAHPGLDAVGLTLSAAQKKYCDELLGRRADVRLEAWQEHLPSDRYDGILSFGAFEHFARDGSLSVERVLAYRRFFASCHAWLVPGGRLGLETIAHDDAPDTAALKGRGPLGDAVLDLFPESLCPHLPEIVLGFEPWFRLEVLRSDPADFARTFRAWSVGCDGRRRRRPTWSGPPRCGPSGATSRPARSSSGPGP